MVKLRFLGFVLLISGLFLGMGCRQTPKVVKIGLVAPFEGASRAIGYDAIYAARLAVREINEAGGIGEYRVALVALDDGGQIDLAIGVAKSLVLDELLVAVVGHGRMETTAIAQPIYEEADLLFLPLGEGEYGPRDPAELSPAFHEAYEAVTPFDEVVDVYAGGTYEAFQVVFREMQQVYDETGEISRFELSQSLHIED